MKATRFPGLISGPEVSSLPVKMEKRISFYGRLYLCILDPNGIQILHRHLFFLIWTSLGLWKSFLEAQMWRNFCLSNVVHLSKTRDDWGVVSSRNFSWVKFKMQQVILVNHVEKYQNSNYIVYVDLKGYLLIKTKAASSLTFSSGTPRILMLKA